MGKTRELTVPGRYECVSDACGFVVQGASMAGFTDRELFHIELCCDEACTNVIEHGYGAEDVGELKVTWEFDDDVFVVTIHDNGAPFGPEDAPKPSVPTDPNDLDRLKIGGLGLHFIHKLMDEVRFIHEEGHGNRLVMVKYRRGKDS